MKNEVEKRKEKIKQMKREYSYTKRRERNEKKKIVKVGRQEGKKGAKVSLGQRTSWSEKVEGAGLLNH